MLTNLKTLDLSMNMLVHADLSSLSNLQRSLIVLSLLATLLASPALPECIEGNCTKPIPVFTLNIGSIFPFFGPVDFDANRDREPLEDAIDPLQAPSNGSDSTGDIISVPRYEDMEVISFSDPSKVNDQSSVGNMPILRTMFDNVSSDIGVLDLSGKTMTSADLYIELRDRHDRNHPVTVLILSNSQIHPMDATPFRWAEMTIHTLVMDNSTVNLDALCGFANLRVLNFSNNVLDTFAWYEGLKDSLEVLDLSHNMFEEVRPELSMFRNLRELYLSNNKISSLEESPLNMLTNLETLDLSMNMLVHADLSSLGNLQRLNVDWNFLRRVGYECLLPPQRLSLKLASNPWRCDCALLQARDSNEVLDIDQLMCANHGSYGYCDGCPRDFLPQPDADRQIVSELTKDSIQHLDCFDLPELYHAIYKLKQNEPEKFFKDICLFTALVILLIVSVLFVSRMCCCKKNSGRKFWLRVQQIPHLSFEKAELPQELPYIKIDEPAVKA